MPPKRKAVMETEKKAKKKFGVTDLGWDLKWSEIGEEIKPGLPPVYGLTSDTLNGCSKVAGFDIDSTIIKTKSGRTFPTGPSDWIFFDKCIPDKLKEYDMNGYRIVFFTNQNGIEKGKAKASELMSKFEAIVTEIGCPILIFVSTGQNEYRKPATKMWDYFVSNCNKSVAVEKSQCVYVGDAAGRPKNWAVGKSKDFSASDRMFAHNIGIDFKTPEEFFLGWKECKQWEWGSFDPSTIKLDAPANKKYHSEEQEIVLLIGPPASGKSTFSRKYFKEHGYVIVNRDTLGNQTKCLKEAELALQKKKSVVSDNTNPSKKARTDYINLAKQYKIPIRCYILQTKVELAKHLNMFRVCQTDGKIRRIPDVGYNIYKKNYEEPHTSEGFKEVLQLPFIPQFENDKEKQLFMQWTC